MVASLTEADKVIEQQHIQVEELTRKLHSSLLNIKMLQHQVDQLLRWVYGRRSEKMDPNQLMFDNLLP
ncbi:MAG: transposase, partial [Deltaproteobacteria bacterium]|nr:transposase [Deltaproteobacteria bacterium]